MARTQSWLAGERTAMLGILSEMERNSSYNGGGVARGDLSLMLARLSQVAAGQGGRARSLSAMRQAWWRWTTDGPNASTPPVQELALMVRYAKNHGWLRDLSRIDCLSLVERLMKELNERRASQDRIREASWEPTLRMGVEGFVDFLEARIAARANGELEAIVIPSAVAIQDEVRTMLKGVAVRVLKSLDEPRDLFKVPHESDSFLQPDEGWPEMFLELAAEMSAIFTDAAEEYRNIEASLAPSPASAGGTAQRRKIFYAPPVKPRKR